MYGPLDQTGYPDPQREWYLVLTAGDENTTLTAADHLDIPYFPSPLGNGQGRTPFLNSLSIVLQSSIFRTPIPAS